MRDLEASAVDGSCTGLSASCCCCCCGGGAATRAALVAKSDDEADIASLGGNGSAALLFGVWSLVGEDKRRVVPVSLDIMVELEAG